jgi:putative transposase
MPRRPRVRLDGIPLHIVQRGHNREPCFFSEEDYFSYLHWLDEALVENECILHAYVLMTNHVHLLLTPTKADAVPKLIMSLGRRYVQYINRTYKRTGTLWDSRYKSSLVQADTYLLRCQRYIELNPVRAAMVEDLADLTHRPQGQVSTFRPQGQVSTFASASILAITLLTRDTDSPTSLAMAVIVCLPSR